MAPMAFTNPNQRRMAAQALGVRPNPTTSPNPGQGSPRGPGFGSFVNPRLGPLPPTLGNTANAPPMGAPRAAMAQQGVGIVTDGPPGMPDHGAMTRPVAPGAKPDVNGLPPRFADFGPQRLAQELLKRPDLATMAPPQASIPNEQPIPADVFRSHQQKPQDGQRGPMDWLMARVNPSEEELQRLKQLNNQQRFMQRMTPGPVFGGVDS